MRPQASQPGSSSQVIGAPQRGQCCQGVECGQVSEQAMVGAFREKGGAAGLSVPQAGQMGKVKCAAPPAFLPIPGPGFARIRGISAPMSPLRPEGVLFGIGPCWPGLPAGSSPNG